MAALLEDALLEEGGELADGVFGQMEVGVGSEGGAGRRQHHPEQVPQVPLEKRRAASVGLQLIHIQLNVKKSSCLQVSPALSDHPLVTVSKQLLGRELEGGELKRRHTLNVQTQRWREAVWFRGDQRAERFCCSGFIS